jgi:hypothetical protein
MLIHNEAYQKIIYGYYAVEMYRSDLKYGETEQSKNYWKKMDELRGNTGQFEKLLEKIESIQKTTVLERSTDLSYVAEFYLPKPIGPLKVEACVIVISGIVELFSVYLRSDVRRTTTLSGIRSKEEFDFINHISELVKQDYPGYEPFPMDLFHTRVPGVDSSLRFNDYATYFECLMTEHVH